MPANRTQGQGRGSAGSGQGVTIHQALEEALRNPHPGRWYPTGAPARSQREWRVQTRRVAEEEASGAGIGGDLRALFIRQRETGRITALEDVSEQGILDELITPLTLGLVHGPGAGSAPPKFNPKAPGKIEQENNPSFTENAEKALPNVAGEILAAIKALVSGYGVRLLEVLAGAGLVLFGLVTLAKGSTPNLPAAVPVPV